MAETKTRWPDGVVAEENIHVRVDSCFLLINDPHVG